MTTLESLLRAIVADPLAEPRYLVLADYLEEHDDPRRAELLRLHGRLLVTCCEPERHAQRADWQASIVAMLAEGVRPCVPTRSVVLAEGVDMTFNFVPPGTFLMGSPEGEEGRHDDEALHRVTLTKGVWMGVYPVTQAQWRTVMGSNPSHFSGDRLPVENVSWDDCVGFCGRLGAKVGQEVRLPGEVEWEYACRAGTTTPFHFGETLAAEQANHDAGQGETTAVASYPCNAWGLFDMHGNVEEWCQDGYGPYREEGENDQQADTLEEFRVLRGGCWDDPPAGCRSAARSLGEPGERSTFFGFRVVLCPDA